MSDIAAPLLAVRGLDVRFRGRTGDIHAVRGLDLDIARGETVAIVGESGSGKSQAMLAIMGLLAGNGTATGSALYRGVELIGAPAATLDRYRGSKLTMIFQEPMTSLDPLYRIGQQMAAPLRRHANMTKAAARQRALDLLDLVRIRQPHDKIDAYPHELSGGERQRVMIAMALALDPDLLIADEPTTALDVTVQAGILALLAELQQRLGLAIVFVTHDLGLVRRIASRVYVMHQGRCVESGPTARLFDAPADDYTRRLLEAEPRGAKVPIAADAPMVLQASGIRVQFKGRRSVLATLAGKPPAIIDAVAGVDLSVKAGETVGIVGESGSGKSTLGRAILKLLPSAGTVRFEDRDLAPLDRARHAATASENAGGVPGPLWFAVAADDFSRDRDRGAAGARTVTDVCRPRPPRRAGLRRSAARSRDSLALSARILRRPAAASRHCPRHDPEAAPRRAR